eukprot:GILJ01010745.1.p1 GENE.GILJ01010745.1~~GILJ01010745.1.p1  ORF type:complete len:786 (+),score=96.38 GILJ01010745.1:172-2529(+)
MKWTCRCFKFVWDVTTAPFFSISHVDEDRRARILTLNVLLMTLVHVASFEDHIVGRTSTIIWFATDLCLWLCYLLMRTNWRRIAITTYVLVCSIAPYLAAASLFGPKSSQEVDAVFKWLIFPLGFLAFFTHYRVASLFAFLHLVCISNFYYWTTLIGSRVNSGYMYIICLSLFWIITNICQKYEATASVRAKQVFTSSISHELRTPLNGIIAPLELLREKPLRADHDQLTKLALKSSEHMLAVVCDVVDFAQADSGRLAIVLQEFDFQSFVTETVFAMSATAASKNLSLEVDFHKDVPLRVRTDPFRLKQVFNNLLSNAFKFTDAGSVKVKVSVVPRGRFYDEPLSLTSHAQFEASCARRDNGVWNDGLWYAVKNWTKQRREERHKDILKFEIEDTGTGVKDEHYSLLFKPFTQLHQDRVGTGLGLVIVEKLARLLGGHTGFSSVYGKGSTFWFTLQVDAVIASSSRASSASALGSSECDARAATDASAPPVRLYIPDSEGCGVSGMDDADRTRASSSFCRRGTLAASDFEGSLADTSRHSDTTGRSSSSRGLDPTTACCHCSITPRIDVRVVPNVDATPDNASSVGCVSVFSPSSSSAICSSAHGSGSSGGLTDRSDLSYISSRLDFEDECGRASTGFQEPGHTLRVLIAEDNIFNQEVITMLLNSINAIPVIYGNGLECLEAYKRNPLMFGALLMDCQMPVMDGFDATKNIKEAEKELNIDPIPIIGLTADASEGTYRRCMQLGMKTVLNKPVRKTLLVDTLKTFVPTFQEHLRQQGTGGMPS